MQHEDSLDAVSKAAVGALAQALSGSLHEGAQNAVDEALENMESGLGETSRRLVATAERMSGLLEGAAERTEQQVRSSLSQFEQQAPPRVAQEIAKSVQGAISDVSQRQTTGAVVEVRFNDSAEPAFSQVLHDGSANPIDLEAFRRLCVTAEAPRRLRVAWPVGRVPGGHGIHPEVLRGLVLYDTPGYNACRKEHVDLLSRTLPEADGVIGMLNFTRGFTPEDREFFAAVRDSVAETSFVAAVNWLPPSGGTRRLEAMKADALSALGREVPLFPLEKTASSPKARVWSGDLWKALDEIATSPGRAKTLDQNVRSFVEAGIIELCETLTTRQKVAAAREPELRRLRAEIGRRRGILQEAEAAVTQSRADMLSQSREALAHLRQDVWQKADAAISDGGRFTEARICTNYVTNHVISQGFREGTARVEKVLLARSDALSERLEKLQQDVDEIPEVEVSVHDPAVNALRDAAARAAVKKGTGFAFEQYLTGLGGAAGPKAGFVNLAKKTVSKVGKLFNKTFSRQFYNQMGPLLRKLGLSASLATAGIVAVVLEAAAYLYNVVRWKTHLRGILQRVLEIEPKNEPFEDSLMRKVAFWAKKETPPVRQMEDELTVGIDETMDTTLQIVRQNFGRRIQVLESSLAAREAPDAESVRTANLAAELSTLLEQVQTEGGQA